jgi:hypothetical protein
MYMSVWFLMPNGFSVCFVWTRKVIGLWGSVGRWRGSELPCLAVWLTCIEYGAKQVFHTALTVSVALLIVMTCSGGAAKIELDFIGTLCPPAAVICLADCLCRSTHNSVLGMLMLFIFIASFLNALVCIVFFATGDGFRLALSHIVSRSGMDSHQ